MIVQNARSAVAGGGFAIFVAVVLAYVIGAQFLPIRTLSMFAFAATLISTVLILWLYRRAIVSVFRERNDVGYMWFSLGFMILVTMTVLNVGYGAWNYAWRVTIISSNSYFLSALRFGYMLAFFCLIVAAFTPPLIHSPPGVRDPRLVPSARVPPRGWGAILAIIAGALVLSGAVVAFRGEM